MPTCRLVSTREQLEKHEKRKIASLHRTQESSLVYARANQYEVNELGNKEENSHKMKFPRKENKRKNEGEENTS